MYANFHEKALFVKADLAASVWPSVTGPALRAMLPSALSVSQLSVTRCIMGSVFSDYQEGAAIFAAVSPTRRGGPSSQLRSRLVLEIRSDRTEAVLRATLGSSPSCQARLPSFSDFPAWPSYSPSLSRLLPTFASVGVAEGIVDLPAHPQTVQEYRQLPRHGHDRSLLRVLASAGGYLLSMTS